MRLPTPQSWADLQRLQGPFQSLGEGTFAAARAGTSLSLDWRLRPGHGREGLDRAFGLEGTNPGPCTPLSARWCLPAPASPAQHWRREK